MLVDKNYMLNVWLSKDCYTSKPVSDDYRKMKWDNMTLTLENFISNIRSGHSYCHIYHGSRRTKSEFLFSQVVSIDVDDSSIPLRQFIRDCAFKPTIGYETFSNGIDGAYSYRLVFVFEEKLSAVQYQTVYGCLCSLCDLTDTKDHCGKVLTQLMNGTTPCAEVFVSNIIYSITSDSQFELEVAKTGDEKEQRDNKRSGSTPYIISNNQKQYKLKVAKCKTAYDDSFDAIDMLENDIEGFLNFYGKIFRVIREDKIYFNECGYCVIPAGHLSLFVRYSRTKNGTLINRFKDGEKRRNRLFIDGCIIRKIKPSITFLELLYNLAHRVHYYYDNSDGVLSPSLLIQKTNEVLRYDVAGMVFDSLDAGRITTSGGFCRNHGISRQAYSRHVMMMENYANIREWYDPNKSVRENYSLAI